MNNMKSITLTFKELFEYLSLKDICNKLQVSEKNIYVPTVGSQIVPILGYIKKSGHDIYEYELENGELFRVSDEHLVFENSVCKKIKHCQCLDTVDGTMFIKTARLFEKCSTVYDISLDSPHIYVTPNGVIHHNTSFGLGLLEQLARAGYNAGYASGEESVYQLAFTSRRLGVKNVRISEETKVEKICEEMQNFDIMVLDSFQMMDTEKEGLTTRKKEKYIIDCICKAAKETECAVIVIMHLTKDGKLKGTTYVPHIVQVNIQILPDKEVKDLRIISVYKNRYGACDDHQTILGPNGYQFQGVYAPESMEEVVVESKVPLSVKREKTVLEMKEPPHITMGRVMEELDISRQTAYLLLKEMEEKNKIQKFGRGGDAIWKIVNTQPKKEKEKIFDV